MELEKIFSLIDKAESSSFNKVKIQIEDVKLTLERGDGTPKQPVIAPAEQSKKEKRDEEDLILAPISGVFYVAKEPGAEPFVTEGCGIKKGDTVCIIEAMKTMNQIVAPRSGVIERVFFADGETVAARDALFGYAREK